MVLSHSPEGISKSRPETWETVTPPKRSNCPIASARFVSMTESIASRYTAISPLRDTSNESKAPALIKDSIVFLLQTWASTFAKKSPKDVKRPLTIREFLIDATTPSPTLRIATRPNRISALRGVYSASDSFTSGGNTRIPIRRHSLKYNADLSLSSRTLVNNAAMYSVG